MMNASIGVIRTAINEVQLLCTNFDDFDFADFQVKTKRMRVRSRLEMKLFPLSFLCYKLQASCYGQLITFRGDYV